MPSPIAPFVAPQAPAAPAAPHAAPRAPAAHPFAEMLRQTRASEAPAPPATPETAEAEPPDTPDASRPPATAKAKGRNAAAPTPQRAAPGPAEKKDSAEATTTRAADREAHAGSAPDDNGLAQWIADLQWRATGAAEEAGAASGDSGQGADAVGRGAGRDAKGLADAGRLGAQAKDSTTPREALDRFATLHADKIATLEADAPQRRGDAAPAARAEPGAAPAPIGLVTSPAPSAAAAPSVVDVAVPTPLNAPDFAQALGLQVSVLAKDGIHHAELHLNPADMGPVSVQIVMDGTQARIEFGADLAPTRQALEAGIPELASALRDAGLTLSGGGVSEHARGRGDGSGEPRREGRPAAIEGSAGVDPLRGAGRRLALAGGVDVYA